MTAALGTRIIIAATGYFSVAIVFIGGSFIARFI